MKKIFQQAQTESSDIIDELLNKNAKEFEQIYEDVYKKILSKIDVKDGNVQYLSLIHI
jgi:hypothetical protein